MTFNTSNGQKHTGRLFALRLFIYICNGFFKSKYVFGVCPSLWNPVMREGGSEKIYTLMKEGGTSLISSWERRGN